MSSCVAVCAAFVATLGVVAAFALVAPSPGHAQDAGIAATAPDAMSDATEIEPDVSDVRPDVTETTPDVTEISSEAAEPEVGTWAVLPSEPETAPGPPRYSAEVDLSYSVGARKNSPTSLRRAQGA